MLSRRRVLFGGALVGVVGCGSADNFASGQSPIPASPAGTQPAVSRLFVVNATSGTRNGAQLRMLNVAPDVVWFDDRPARSAGRQSTFAFVQDWGLRGFASDPPNAVIQIDNLSFPVILTQPIFEGASQSLTFVIQPDVGAPSIDQLPTQFGACALFIDDDSSTAGMSLSLTFSMKAGDTVEVLLSGVGGDPRFAVGLPDFQSGLVVNSTTPLAPLSLAVFFNSILVSLPNSGSGAEFDLDLFLVAQPGIQAIQLNARGSQFGSQVSVTFPSQSVITSEFTQFAWVDL